MRLAMPGPWKHPTTGTYYLRQRAPSDLAKKAKGKLLAVPVDGATKTVKVGDGVKVSLMTKDPATAKQRFRDTDAALQRHWEAMRSGPVSLSQKETAAIAGLAYRAFVETFDNNPGSPEFWTNILKRNAEAGGGGGTLRIGSVGELQAQTMEKRFGSIVDGILRAQSLIVDDASRKRLIVETMGSLNKAAIANLKKAQGDYSPDPHGQSFPVFQDRKAIDAVVTVSGLFDQWKKEHAQTGGATSTARRWKPVIDSLTKHLGHDDASKVTLKDALEWKDKLLDSGAVTHSTFKKVYRAALSTIYTAGVANLKITYNPFRELRVKAPKKRKERMQGFTDEEAKAILRAALAAGENSRAGQKTRSARRWIPWLCAYSGARVGEIAQLRKESVRPVEGIPCYWITPEDGDVKDKEPRFVPIHAHLIEQGFLEFVEKAPGGPLFYDAKTKRQSPGEGPAADLRTWVRDVAKIKDPRVQPNHAWRHTFKNIAGMASIAPMYADMICGHQMRTEGEKYSDRQAPLLAKEMKKFPRFET